MQLCLLCAWTLGQHLSFQKSHPFHAVCLGLTSLGKELDWHHKCLCQFGIQPTRQHNSLPGFFQVLVARPEHAEKSASTSFIAGKPSGTTTGYFRKANQIYSALQCLEHSRWLLFWEDYMSHCYKKPAPASKHNELDVVIEKAIVQWENQGVYQYFTVSAWEKGGDHINH